MFASNCNRLVVSCGFALALMAVGCDSNRVTIVIPTEPLTKEQLIAAKREEAMACNCSCDIESNSDVAGSK